MDFAFAQKLLSGGDLETSETPDVLEDSEDTETPEAPEDSEALEDSETPETSEVLEDSEDSKTPETPDVLEDTETPDVSETPETPDALEAEVEASAPKDESRADTRGGLLQPGILLAVAALVALLAVVVCACVYTAQITHILRTNDSAATLAQGTGDGNLAIEALSESDITAASLASSTAIFEAVFPISESAASPDTNIEPQLQNNYGLYSGCELVSLSMMLDSWGIDVDPLTIVQDYLEYLPDDFALEYTWVGADGPGEWGEGRFGGMWPSGDDSAVRQDDAEDGATEDGTTADGTKATTEDDNAEDDATEDGAKNADAAASSSMGAIATLLTDTIAQTSATDGATSVTDYYIGDPFSDGMGYPPAIAKAARAIVEEEGSDLMVCDLTGIDASMLSRIVKRGFPLIVWVTLDYSEPILAQWQPVNEDDWTWYNNMHCVLITGYDAQERVYSICDPLQGYLEMPAEQLESVFAQCGNMAISVS